MLLVQVFNDGFDDEVAVVEIVERGGAEKTIARGFLLFGGDGSFIGESFQRLLDRGETLLQEFYREDSYALEVEMKPEVASRLGMNSTVVSNMLAGTFMGLPVSRFWEGDRGVDIVDAVDNVD